MPHATTQTARTTPLLHRSAGVALLLAALTLPTWAQPGADEPRPAMQGQERPQAGMQAGRMQERMQERMHERMQARMSRLKEQLQLTPEQDGAWATFQEAMRPVAQRPRMPNRQEMSRLSTPERIDRMRQLREQHTSEANRKGDAAKAFYAQLTPAQQKIFDTQSMHLIERMDQHNTQAGPQRGAGAGPKGPSNTPN